MTEETKTSTKTTVEQQVEHTIVAALEHKQLWLDWAEITDAWRLVPRMILFGLFIWNVYLIDRIWSWYSHLPTAERSTQDAILIGSIVTAVTSMFTLAVKFYQNSGRTWSGQSLPTQNQ